jgi:hypothetical protein
MSRVGDLLPALLASQARKGQVRTTDATDIDKADALVNAMQPHQRALRDSTSDHDAVIAPRQTGKSWAVLMLAFECCLRTKEAQVVIVGPTLESLKRNYLTPFRLLNRKFELGIRFNKTERAFHCKNGSIVYFIGADKAGEVDKVRGGAFNLVIVDESQFFPLADFDYMLSEVLEYTISARRGRLIIIGTPGTLPQGEFYLATCTPPERRVTEDGVEGPLSNYLPGKPSEGALWCKHCWNPQANAAAPHIWEKALRVKAAKGWADDNPKWLREGLGLWVAVTDELVYRYKTHRNSYRHADLPELPGGQQWKHVLGVDLGSKDGTAMVVWAYSPHSPNLYERYSKREVKTDLQPINVSFIARWRNQLAEEFGPFEREVCDPGGLADIILETLLDDHGIFWEKAAVKQKEDHIALVNDDFDSCRLFLLRGSELEKDVLGNRWEKDKKTGKVPEVGKRKEDDKTPNDVADAGLYSFRWCYHRRYTSPQVVVMSAIERFIADEKAAIHAKYRQHALDSEDPCRNLN